MKLRCGCEKQCEDPFGHSTNPYNIKAVDKINWRILKTIGIILLSIAIITITIFRGVT